MIYDRKRCDRKYRFFLGGGGFQLRTVRDQKFNFVFSPSQICYTENCQKFKLTFVAKFEFVLAKFFFFGFSSARRNNNNL